MKRNMIKSALIAVAMMSLSVGAMAQGDGNARDTRSNVETIVLSTCYADTPWDENRVVLNSDIPTQSTVFYNAYYSHSFLTKQKLLLIITNEYGQVTQREVETSEPGTENFHVRSTYNRPETFSYAYVKGSLEATVRAYLLNRETFKCAAGN